jgi:Cu+-exporting ATPase
MEVAMESKARDPVCGVSLDASASKRKSTYCDHDYFFCSDACREKFQTNPAGFSKAGGDGSAC